MDGVDFYVYGHLPIHIGGVTVYITTTHICLDEGTDRIFKCHRAFSGNP